MSGNSLRRKSRRAIIVVHNAVRSPGRRSWRPFGTSVGGARRLGFCSRRQQDSLRVAMYVFRTPSGVMVIARHGEDWFATFNGVVLGQFPSAQIAARALADPVDFSAALRAFLADLAIPADLAHWRTLD